MCWGVPARVLDIDGMIAKVDFGGSVKDVLIINDDIKQGDLVIVHAGAIIGKIEDKEIENTIRIYGDLLKDSLIDDGVEPGEASETVEKWIRKLLGEGKDG